MRGGERKGEPWRSSALGESFPPPLAASLVEPRVNWVRFSERTFPASYTTVFPMCFEVKYRVVDGFSSRRNQQKK